MKKLFVAALATASIFNSYGQTLFVPNGTVGSSGTANCCVGIGTSTPSNLQGWDRVLDVSAANYSKILATVSSQSYRMGIYAHNSWNGGGGFVGTESNHKLFFISNNNVQMTLDVNGNLGVGTASPGAKLHVSGSGNIEPIIEATDNSNASVLFRSNGKTWQWSKRTTGESDMMQLNYHNGTAWQSSAVSILTSGNVGIGTISPDYPLTVKGSIHAKEVRVDLTGPLSVPDYVFEKDYKLPSLDEIKAYIDQNKHLPEVPSAKEIEKNGVQLGEMNLILLKKIEELTLHMIKQQEEIQRVTKKNAELEERVQQLTDKNK